MMIDGRLPIANYAAEVPGAMAIFELLGLDYACAGERSLDDAAILDDVATLEAHLHESMFLENCILFPRAAMLAEQVGDEAAVRGA